MVGSYYTTLTAEGLALMLSTMMQITMTDKYYISLLHGLPRLPRNFPARWDFTIALDESLTSLEAKSTENSSSQCRPRSPKMRF